MDLLPDRTTGLFFPRSNHTAFRVNETNMGRETVSGKMRYG
jgi:hypothetical protein